MKKFLIILCCIIGCEGRVHIQSKPNEPVDIGQLPIEKDHIHKFGQCHHKVFINTKHIYYSTQYNVVNTSCNGKYIHIKYKKEIWDKAKYIATYLMKDVEICPYD